jgi:hypothetical protein
VPAISLHIYAAPLKEFSVYDETTQRRQTVRSTYDAVLSISALASAAR